MVTLLTLKQEVQGLNPGAAPPKFGAQTPPYLASRLQICFKGPLPPKRGHVAMVQAECRAPGMTGKKIGVFLSVSGRAPAGPPTRLGQVRRGLQRAPPPRPLGWRERGRIVARGGPGRGGGGGIALGHLLRNEQAQVKKKKLIHECFARHI